MQHHVRPVFFTPRQGSAICLPRFGAGFGSIYNNVVTTKSICMANAYRKHIWLLETLKRFKRLNYEEINELWQRSALNDLGEDLSKRTLNNHVNAIFATYGIEIKCEQGGLYRYYIAGSDDYFIKAQHDAFISNSMIQSCMANRAMQGRVLMTDDFKDERITIITEAMNRSLKIRVHRFRDCSDVLDDQGNTCEAYNEDYYVTVSPYFIAKLPDFWYLFFEMEGKIRAFGFYLMKEVEITDEPFVFPPSFNSQAFLSEIRRKEIWDVGDRDDMAAVCAMLKMGQ
jgi:hypothetical protein